jgi:hypothetical protein
MGVTRQPKKPQGLRSQYIYEYTTIRGQRNGMFVFVPAIPCFLFSSALSELNLLAVLCGLMNDSEQTMILRSSQQSRDDQYKQRHCPQL